MPLYKPKGVNTPLSAGMTMDNQLIRGLFKNTISATEALGIDKKFRRKQEKRCTPEHPYTARQCLYRLVNGVEGMRNKRRTED